jgi:tRNA threonylcarbamoyladenosine biosynthesis protein TsaE
MTISQKIVTRTPEETRQAGRRLAKELKAGDVVLLEGTLGAGKTCFAAGLCEALGCRAGEVVSPTFSLVNQYQGAVWTVFHVDLYRIESPAQLESLGLEEILYAGGISLVEWPERLGGFLPETYWKVRLSYARQSGREIEISRH